MVGGSVTCTSTTGIGNPYPNGIVYGRRPGLRVIDVREGLDSTTYVIPGAEAVQLEQIGGLAVAPGQHLVLYSDGGTHAAQAWVLLRMRGITDVHVLKDGMAAWEDEVLSPRMPAVAADSARQRYERARSLALWFGGRPRLPDAAGAAPPSLAPRPRRRNTC